MPAAAASTCESAKAAKSGHDSGAFERGILAPCLRIQKFRSRRPPLIWRHHPRFALRSLLRGDWLNVWRGRAVEVLTWLSAPPHRASPSALRIQFPCHHAKIGYRIVAAPGEDRSTSRSAAKPAAPDQHTAFRAAHPAEAQASLGVIGTASPLPRPAARWRQDTARGNLSDRAASRHRVRAIEQEMACGTADVARQRCRFCFKAVTPHAQRNQRVVMRPYRAGLIIIRVERRMVR